MTEEQGTQSTHESQQSIHDLFAKVRAHPDYRFGVIFVADDVDGDPDDEDAEGYPGWYDGGVNHEKHAEERITSAGFEYLDNECRYAV